MAESYTTPHSLPILGTGDLVRSPSGDNLRKQLNALATATGSAISAEGAKYIPAWKANTAYTAGQRVIAPNGDVVAAKVAFTSAASYSVANWTASTQDGRIGAVEAGKLDANDPRVPTFVDTQGKSVAITANGSPTWLQANDTDGGPTPDAAAAVRKSAGLKDADAAGVSVMFSANGNPTWLQANDTDGGPTADAAAMIRAAVADPEATASAHIDATRNLKINTASGPRIIVPNSATIVAHGDSYVAPNSQSWTTKLAESLPANTVVSLGVGGNTADIVAIRYGAIRPKLTVVGGAVPASGAIEVTFADTITFRDDTTFSEAGVLEISGQSIPGTLARTGPGTRQWSFTRTSAGTSITGTTGVYSSDRYSQYIDALPLILCGRNDVSLGEGAVDTALTGIISMVESQTAVIKRCLLMGVNTDVGFTAGTPYYEWITTINRELSRIYPDFFWDMRAYLVNQCIYDAGITPTQADLDAMAADTCPPSIMDPDQLHMNASAHAQVAIQVKNQLTVKGWI